jgi:DNA modification methylase
MPMGNLFFGDNLDILREHIKAESIDLVYLDPPFNSKRDYNLLFKTPKGHDSDAQISAFDDSWHWGEQAEKEFSELLHQPNTDIAEMIQALRRFLKESDLMAYLVMMANRLLELHRVLKPTGSIYLHCDPTASHYLKIVLDTVFGAENFCNHITWQRSDSHNDAKNQFPATSDHILFYQKSKQSSFYPVYVPHAEKTLKEWYLFIELPDGSIRRMTKGELQTQTIPAGARRFNADNMTSPNPRPNLMYNYKGYPYPAKGWRYSLETMEELDKKGKLLFPSNPDGRIMRKRYLDEQEGVTVGDVWIDISQLRSSMSERLGYPTQKPLALLERIIQASSNEGDIILDPFCGCGTAVHAAQNLKREWVGIDITHLAISLIEKRLKDAFPAITFEIFGTPKDLAGARNLAERDKYQFQWWACSLVNAQPYQGKKKGADGGTDGLIFFQDDEQGAKKIIVSVKGGENVTRTMIADLKNTVEREKAEIGLFVTLAEATKPMITEAASAGFYSSTFGEFPKIQILTIEDLLSGKAKPNTPPDLSRGSLTFKKAKTEKERAEQSKLGGF